MGAVKEAYLSMEDAIRTLTENQSLLTDSQAERLRRIVTNHTRKSEVKKMRAILKNNKGEE